MIAASSPLRLDGNAVWFEGALLGTVTIAGKHWRAVPVWGEPGPLRSSRAGAIGDLIPTVDHGRSTPTPTPTPTALVVPRADGRVELGGRVMDLDALRELHASIGQLLRAAEGHRDPDAYTALALALDAEFRDARIVLGTGRGERQARLAIRRADDGGVVARVSRFGIARLTPRRRNGAVYWRGLVVMLVPDELLGAVSRPTRRHVSVPELEVEQLQVRQLAGPVEPPPSGPRVVRPARLPAARALSTLKRD